MEDDRSATLDASINTLDLSVRAGNCLEADGVATIRQLVQRTESELMRLRSFGRTSLFEVRRKLESLGLRLEMSQRDVLRWERFGE